MSWIAATAASAGSLFSLQQGDVWWVQYQEILAHMPVTSVHKSEGRTHIAAAIESHGGMAVVSKWLELKNRPRAKELFKDWSPFRRALL